MDISVISDPLIIIGGGVVRSVFGWWKKAWQDKTVTKFEWRQLGGTVVRVATMTAIGYYGLTVSGIDVPVVSAAAGGYIADLILQAWKKGKK